MLKNRNCLQKSVYDCEKLFQDVLRLFQRQGFLIPNKYYKYTGYLLLEAMKTKTIVSKKNYDF